MVLTADTLKVHTGLLAAQACILHDTFTTQNEPTAVQVLPKLLTVDDFLANFVEAVWLDEHRLALPSFHGQVGCTPGSEGLGDKPTYI